MGSDRNQGEAFPMADSMTVLRSAGPPGTKRNIAILGDGFAPADQDAYNQWVQTTLIEGVFGHDYFSEDASAYNIYRVNLESVDSGVSTRTYDEHGTPSDPTDDTIASETIRNTALGIIFSGSWAHCWLEYGTGTEARIQAALNTWVPDWNELLVVLNNPNYGGCGGGGRAHVPMGVQWQVIAHEFGHGIGGFSDEYSAAGTGAYTGGEQGWIDLTTITGRATTKWHQFIAPTTPLPTGTGPAADYNNGPRPATWDSNQDVGLFEGGGTYETGIYRPVENCRMNSNTPPYCPVCYTSIKTARDGETGHHFRNAYPGFFYGTGRSDLLLHHGTSIQLFAADGTALSHRFSGVERVPGSWQFQPHDQVYVGDFNGDGADEVAIFNGVDWAIPYLVDGPLAAPTALRGAAAYEVTAGDRLVHAAAVPDLWLEQRSFPNLEGPPDQRGHHFAERATSELSVRIPAEELTAETIGAVRVRLYRLVEPASGVRVGAQSLSVQLREGVEPVAELAGLPESVLPGAIEARGGRTGQGA
jgi:hypothetical protein